MPNKSPLQIEFERQLKEFDETMITKRLPNGYIELLENPIDDICTIEVLKDFLTSCQQSTVKKMIEMIEGKISEPKHEPWCQSKLKGECDCGEEMMVIGRNSALSDILSELNKAIL